MPRPACVAGSILPREATEMLELPEVARWRDRCRGSCRALWWRPASAAGATSRATCTGSPAATWRSWIRARRDGPARSAARPSRRSPTSAAHATSARSAGRYRTGLTPAGVPSPLERPALPPMGGTCAVVAGRSPCPLPPAPCPAVPVNAPTPAPPRARSRAAPAPPAACGARPSSCAGWRGAAAAGRSSRSSAGSRPGPRS